MNGSVKKHGPTWRYRIDLGPDPLTGKRRQLTKGGYRTKRDAQNACNEALENARRGQLDRISRKTVADFMEDWITSRKLDMKPSAWRGYRDYLDAYVLPIVGTTPLQDLDTIRLNLLYVHLLEQGCRKVDRDAKMHAFYLAEIAAGRRAESEGAGRGGRRHLRRRPQSPHPLPARPDAPTARRRARAQEGSAMSP